MIRDPAHLLIETLFSFQRSTQFLFITLNKNPPISHRLKYYLKLENKCQQVFLIKFSLSLKHFSYLKDKNYYTHFFKKRQPLFLTFFA